MRPRSPADGTLNFAMLRCRSIELLECTDNSGTAEHRGHLHSLPSDGREFRCPARRTLRWPLDGCVCNGELFPDGFRDKSTTATGFHRPGYRLEDLQRDGELFHAQIQQRERRVSRNLCSSCEDTGGASGNRTVWVATIH